jgi:hypothetical protein
VHVPAETKVAVEIETVQTPKVDEAKLTAKPEVAVAESVSGVPTVCVPGVTKLIVCERGVTPPTVLPPLPQLMMAKLVKTPLRQANNPSAMDKRERRSCLLLI